MTFSGKTFLALYLSIKRLAKFFANKTIFIGNISLQKSFLGPYFSSTHFFTPYVSKKPFLPTIET